MACPLATERVWFEKSRYHDAEKDYFEHLSKCVNVCKNSKLLKGSLNKNTVEKENDDVSVNNHQSESASGSKLKKTKKSKQTRSSDSTSSTTQAQQKDDNKEVVLEEVTPKIEAPSTTEKENVKNEEAKSKKKKKKKNNNKESEKSQDTLKNEGSERQSNNQQSSQERQKTNHKTKTPGSNQCTLVSEIAKARQHIKNSLERMDGIAALAASPAAPGADVLDRLALLEKENTKLKETVEGLRKLCLDSQNRIKTLESRIESLTVSPAAKKEAPKPAAPKPKEHSDNDDDGVDLFGSDEEEEDQEAAKIREQRLAEYNAKKSKKPALIAKSSVLLDVKPWDDETDLKLMEAEIRKIQTDGLLWGASKFVPVAFGIQKIVISCVVEDDKVSIDWLTEEIEKIEDYVQSVDVAAFNKI